MTFLEPLPGTAFIVALTLLPMSLVVGVLVLRKRFVRDRNRRSPLTSELLRTPGFGLQERIEDISDDIGGYLMTIAWLPLMFFAIYQIQFQSVANFKPGHMAVLYSVMGMIGVIILAVLLIRRVDQRQKYREALAGELATAQLLEPIIAGGGRVLHDVQAPGFNIDHVVVAPGGVFAVETKHRLKSTKGKAMDQVRVNFDGKALRFPDWAETKPVEQAIAQARWLTERLTKSTGQAVTARPVIALPGWFVTTSEKSNVIVRNPKNCGFMCKPWPGEPPLSKERIQAIAFQVEQWCRMPDPTARRGGQRAKDGT